MKIGILGGTFNPLHNGHRKLAYTFLDAVGLDKLLLLPGCVPPHKKVSQLAGTRTRLEMCHAFASEDSRMQVSDYEIIRGGVNYTADTLEFFARVYPEDTLYFVMGSDMFLSLHTWVNPERIFKNAVVCATYRYGDDSKEKMQSYAKDILNLPPDRYVLIESEPFEVSSTQIRQLVSEGGDISSLVPPKVKYIIEQEGLYLDK